MEFTSIRIASSEYQTCLDEGVSYTNNHSNNNNRFQQLELKWVNDHGCFGAMEFR